MSEFNWHILFLSKSLKISIKLFYNLKIMKTSIFLFVPLQIISVGQETYILKSINKINILL